ncbi:hypothetical protein IAT38_005026 [Cryptococcus sp. DSM 104549]
MSPPAADITTLSPLPPNIRTHILHQLKESPSVNLLCTCRAIYEECVYALYRDVALHHRNLKGYLAHPVPEPAPASTRGEGEAEGERAARKAQEEKELCRRVKGEGVGMLLMGMTPHSRMVALRGSTVNLAVLDIEAAISLAETQSRVGDHGFLRIKQPVSLDNPDGMIMTPLFWGLRTFRLGPDVLERMNRCPTIWQGIIDGLMQVIWIVIDLSLCFDFPPRGAAGQRTGLHGAG